MDVFHSVQLMISAFITDLGPSFSETRTACSDRCETLPAHR